MHIEFKSNIKRTMPAIKQLAVNSELEGMLILRVAGDHFIQYAESECPKKTRRLSGSIGKKSGEGVYESFAGGRGLRIGTKVPYARAVNDGVQRAWTITPKDKKVLAFTPKGGKKKIFRKMVTRLPFAGKFFMNRALIYTRRDIPMIARKIRRMRM